MSFYYKGLRLETDDSVYYPAEDSLLIAENLLEEKGRVLDIGTGTGILALVAAKNASKVTATDVNPKALELAGRNARNNEIENIEFIPSDLFAKLSNERFDLIVFNPPYLPVEENDPIGRAWSGGEKGVELIQRFLDSVREHLNPGGKFLLLVSSLNDLNWEEKGLGVVAKKKLFFEELMLLQGTA